MHMCLVELQLRYAYTAHHIFCLIILYTIHPCFNSSFKKQFVLLCEAKIQKSPKHRHARATPILEQINPNAMFFGTAIPGGRDTRVRRADARSQSLGPKESRRERREVTELPAAPPCRPYAAHMFTKYLQRERFPAVRHYNS